MDVLVFVNLWSKSQIVHQMSRREGNVYFPGTFNKPSGRSLMLQHITVVRTVHVKRLKTLFQVNQKD